MEDLKAVDHESLEYNKVGGKALVNYISCKFTPQHYLGEGK